MKRITAVITAIILCTTLIPGAFAEFDLKGLTVNELNELISEAQNEIIMKGGDVVIPAGKYKVGVDIGAGSYDIKFDDESLMASTVDIRDEEGKYADTAYMTYGSWTHMILIAGQTIEIKTTCFIRKGVKLGF